MPEGHTLLRAARLWNSIAGEPLKISSPQGRFAQEAAKLDGLPLLKAEAYGKHLFLYFPKDYVVHIHLALYGRHLWSDAPISSPVGAIRLRAVHSTGALDLNGPHICRLITPTEAEQVKARLGPDPLKHEKLPESFYTTVEKLKTPVGKFLMDQQRIAGIGNVYRAEILFVCGLDPWLPAKDLKKSEWQRLWKVTRDLMIPGVELEGSTVTILPNGPIPASLSKVPVGARDFYVYKSTGLECLACRNPVKEELFYGRTLYFCAICQKST